MVGVRHSFRGHWSDNLDRMDRDVLRVTQKRPNKTPEPTPGLVTPRAMESTFEMNRRNGKRDAARGAPSPVVAHL